MGERVDPAVIVAVPASTWALVLVLVLVLMQVRAPVEIVEAAL